MSARPHFSIARIPVRVEPAFLLVAGLFGLRYLELGLDVVLVWVVCSFISVLVHEMGHGVAFKVFGQPSVIVLHGFGGVTISHRRSTLTRARSILVSVAGSLTGLLLLWLPMRTAFGAIVDASVEQRELVVPEVVWYGTQFLAFQNLWWSVANLLPVRPLDGGNVLSELTGVDNGRRISIAFAIAAAVFAFFSDQTYGGFFFLLLAFMNFQEIRAAQAGASVDAFHVDAPEEPNQRRRGRARLGAVPTAPPAPSGVDPERAQQLAWAALKQGDVPTATRLTRGLGPGADPYLRAATALAGGDKRSFELFEQAYVDHPSGPPNLIATEVVARTGAAVAIAKRLVDRRDGKGREGAATLQTHLHYADQFEYAAEVGTVVYGAAPPSRAQTAFEVACSWARAGDVDHAVEWLERAADDGFRAASLVDGEPDLEVVRADPRWPLLRTRLT